MTCDDRRDLLLLYAAGSLEPDEREALRAHLATGCPACAGALAEAEAIVAHLAAATAPVAPPAGALEQLMARIESRPMSIARGGGRRRALVASLLAAAAAVAVTSGAWFYATRHQRTFWRSDDLATVTLANPQTPTSPARGQVWWDRDNGHWRLVITELPAPPTGREYELWFIPKDGKPIRSETFLVNADGRASLVVSVPPGVGAGAVAAITDEPKGGSDSPTGTIQLAGKFD